MANLLTRVPVYAEINCQVSVGITNLKIKGLYAGLVTLTVADFKFRRMCLAERMAQRGGTDCHLHHCLHCATYHLHQLCLDHVTFSHCAAKGQGSSSSSGHSPSLASQENLLSFQKLPSVHYSVCSQFWESLFAIVVECSQFCLRSS